MKIENVDGVKNICWSVAYNEEQPVAALDTFMKLLIPATNKQAPIKKMIVKTDTFLWIDEELINCMVERDEGKGMANTSGCTTDLANVLQIEKSCDKTEFKQ